MTAAEWAIPGSIHVDAYQALEVGRPGSPGRDRAVGGCSRGDRLRHGTR